MKHLMLISIGALPSFSTATAFANHDPIHIRIVYADNWKSLSYNEVGEAKGLLPEQMEKTCLTIPT